MSGSITVPLWVWFLVVMFASSGITLIIRDLWSTRKKDDRW